MYKAIASIFFATLIAGCSDNNESSTTAHTQAAPQYSNINYSFSFSQDYEDSASASEKVDSVLLKFFYTNASGTIVEKIVAYGYSNVSPRFTDNFMVFDRQLPKITVTEMVGFNNRIGIREKRWHCVRPDLVSQSNEKLLVPVIEIPTGSYAKSYITSITTTKNGAIAFSLDSDTLYADDTVEMVVAGITTNGTFDFYVLTYIGQDDKLSSPYDWLTNSTTFKRVFKTQATITNNSFAIKAKIGWSDLYLSQKRKFIFEMTPASHVYKPSCDTTIMLTISVGSSKMIGIRGGSFKQKIELKLPSRTLDTSRIVTLTSFEISKYPVARGEYNSVMNSVYSPNVNDPLFQSISWVDAARFCNKKSILDGYEIAYDSVTWKLDITKSGYHLPTDAQWEYVARAGTTTKYWWGNVSDSKLESRGFVGDGILNGFGVGGYYLYEMTTDAEAVHTNAGAVNNPTYPYGLNSRLTIRSNDSESRYYSLSASGIFRVARH